MSARVGFGMIVGLGNSEDVRLSMVLGWVRVLGGFSMRFLFTVLIVHVVIYMSTTRN